MFRPLAVLAGRSIRTRKAKTARHGRLSAPKANLVHLLLR